MSELSDYQYFNSNNIRVERNGKIVTVYTTAYSTVSDTITLPAGLRPPISVYFPIIQGTSVKIGYVASDGVLGVHGGGGFTNGLFAFSYGVV